MGQAWYGGLRHFLAVELSAENVTGSAAVPAPAAQRFHDGREPAPQVPGTVCSLTSRLHWNLFLLAACASAPSGQQPVPAALRSERPAGRP